MCNHPSEIEQAEDCPACGGDGGYERPYEIDRRDGSVISHHIRCDRCDGTGTMWVLPQSTSLDDIEQITEEIYGS